MTNGKYIVNWKVSNAEFQGFVKAKLESISQI